jgi:hypothetical protein
MDMGATFDYSDSWNGGWTNPRLDAQYGFHSAKDIDVVWVSISLSED